MREYHGVEIEREKREGGREEEDAKKEEEAGRRDFENLGM